MIAPHKPFHQPARLLFSAAALFVFIQLVLGLSRAPSYTAQAQSAQAQSAEAQPAQAAPSVMVIFDGSGSMWGRLAGERYSKLEQARSALNDALSSRPARSVNVGLYSFGNKRRRDCTDASSLRNLAPLNIPQFMQPLKKFNPKGRGPLTRALRDSGAILGDIEGPASIILIHDGIDNCRGDPCAFAREFSSARPNTPVHVVSIGLNGEDFRSMSCVAQETGGRHFNVQTDGDMQTAIDTAWQISLNAPAPGARPGAISGNGARSRPSAGLGSIPRPVPAVGFSGSGIYLTYSLGPKSAPLNQPARWSIKAVGDAGTAPRQIVQSSTIGVPLPAGDYDVEITYGDLISRKTITVLPTKLTRANISLEAGILNVNAFAGNAAPLTGAVLFSIFKSGAKGQFAPSTPLVIMRAPAKQLIVPAGRYRIKARLANRELTRDIVIAPGKSAALDLSFKIGTLQLSAVTSQDGEPQVDVLFIVFEDDPESPDGRREIARSAGPQAHFALSAGTYTIAARSGNATKLMRLAITAGATTTQRINIDPARLQLSATLGDIPADPAIPVSYKLTLLDQKSARPIISQRPMPRLTLAAGRYRVESRIGLANALLAYEINMAPGQEGKLAMKHQAGQITLRLVAKSGLTVRDALLWHIADAGGQTIKQTVQAVARDILAAGDYVATARWRGRKFQRKFVVRAGDDIAVELKVN